MFRRQVNDFQFTNRKPAEEVEVGVVAFVLKSPTGAVIPATVSYNASTRTATLNPSADLPADRQYTATLIGGATAIRDAAGTPLASTTWTFTTGPAPANTSRTPRPGASLVRRANNVSVTLSEAVQGASTSTFTLKNAATGAIIPATVTLPSSSWTFTTGSF